MTAQVLFFDAFFQKDPHFNAVEIDHKLLSIICTRQFSHVTKMGRS